MPIEVARGCAPARDAGGLGKMGDEAAAPASILQPLAAVTTISLRTDRS